MCCHGFYWDSMIYSHCAYKDIFFVGKSACGTRTSNAEDHFAVTIVKAEIIIGNIPCFVYNRFPIPLSDFQLCFSGGMYAYQLCLTTSNEHALNKQYVLTNHVCSTTQLNSIHNGLYFCGLTNMMFIVRYEPLQCLAY